MPPPPLPSVQNVKDFLRIQTAAEDAVIASLLASALAHLQALAGRSFTHESVTWYDDAETLRRNEAVTRLQLQHGNIDASTVVVKDRDGNTVDPATYLVRLDRGQIVGAPGTLGNLAMTFAVPPYTITCTSGFDTSPTYATIELPIITQAVLHYCAWLYQQRTPGASTEKASGTTVTYVVDKDTGLPMPVAWAIRRLRGVVFARGM